MAGIRNLVLVLGDQPDLNSCALNALNNTKDVVWMAEAEQEATHVWCHKMRIAFFFSAMRHFRDRLLEKNISVHLSVTFVRIVRSYDGYKRRGDGDDKDDTADNEDENIIHGSAPSIAAARQTREWRVPTARQIPLLLYCL